MEVAIAMVLKGRISADTEETWEAAVGMCMKTEAVELELALERWMRGLWVRWPRGCRGREKESPFLLSVSINGGEFILKCF